MNTKQYFPLHALPIQIILISFSIFCSTSMQATKSHQLYVFVHGTVKPPEIPFSSLFQIMRDEIDSLLYKDVVEHLRRDTYYARGQAMQDLGLHPITLDHITERTSSHTVAQLYNIQLETQGIDTSKVLYYTFGWSGLLSDKKRYEASVNLYKELTQELNHLATQGIFPDIHLIGYSHGGNILLYLPEVRKKEKLQPFVVKQLITLATPIQRDTAFFVFDDMFQSVYNFYSLDDNVQTADIFSSKHQFFSKRLFFTANKEQLPEKIKQVRIRIIKKFRKKHTDTEKINYTVLTHKKYKPVYKDPGHSELWCFKSCTHYYRPSFPLNPFPFMIFLPTIIHTIQTHCPDLHNLTCSIAPTVHGMVFSTQKEKITAPFIEKTTYEKMKVISQLFEQTYCDYESQQSHTTQTVETAKRSYNERINRQRSTHKQNNAPNHEPRCHRKLYLKNYRKTLHKYAVTFNLTSTTKHLPYT